MKHKAVLIASGNMAGLIFCCYAMPNSVTCFVIIVLCAAAAISVLNLISFVFNRTADLSKRRMAVLFLLSAAVACLQTASFSLRIDKSIRALPKEPISISGTVVRKDGSNAVVYGRVNGIYSEITITPDRIVDYGDRISFTAAISGLDGMKNKERSYSKRTFFKATSAEIKSVAHGRGIMSAYNKIMAYNDKITSQIQKYSSGKESALLAAMLCGRRLESYSSLHDDMTKTGIGHVLAVSGLHVSLIAGLVAAGLKKLGADRITTFVLSETVMLTYTVFSGMSTSSIRAAIMMTVLLMSRLLMRTYSPISSVSVCIMLMTVFNPFAAVDPSFLLSVSGAFGVGTVSRELVNSFSVNGKVKISLIAAACGTICTLPASCFFFNEISFFSIPANLLFLPLCSISLILIMAFALLGGGDIFGFLIRLAAFPASITVKCSEFIAKTGCASIPVKTPLVPVFVVSCAALVLIIFIAFRSPRKAALFAVLSYSLTFALIFAVTAMNFDSVNMRVVTQNGEFLCIIHSGSQCVAIDSSGTFSYDCENILSEEGLTSPLAVVILKNRPAACADYESSAFPPEKLIMSCSETNDGISESVVRFGSEGCITVFGLDIEFDKNCVSVSQNGESIAVLSSHGGSLSVDTVIASFDGVTVLAENDSIRQFSGKTDLHIRFSDDFADFSAS